MDREIDYIPILTRYESTKIPLDDILYIQRRLRKILVVTSSREIEYYDKIQYVIPLLGDNFYKVLEGWYVNLDRITGVNRDIMTFDNNLEMMIPRQSKASLKQKHFAYYRTKQMKYVREKNTCL